LSTPPPVRRRGDHPALVLDQFSVGDVDVAHEGVDLDEAAGEGDDAVPVEGGVDGEVNHGVDAAVAVPCRPT
jgi:hypothetical protein